MWLVVVLFQQQRMWWLQVGWVGDGPSRLETRDVVGLSVVGEIAEWTVAMLVACWLDSMQLIAHPRPLVER